MGLEISTVLAPLFTHAGAEEKGVPTDITCAEAMVLVVVVVCGFGCGLVCGVW